MICQRSIAKRGICMWCIIILMLINIWMFHKGWEMYQLHLGENHLQGRAKILPTSWINRYVGYLDDLSWGAFDSFTPTNHYYTRYYNIHHRTGLYLHVLVNWGAWDARYSYMAGICLGQYKAYNWLVRCWHRNLISTFSFTLSMLPTVSLCTLTWTCLRL